MMRGLLPLILALTLAGQTAAQLAVLTPPPGWVAEAEPDGLTWVTKAQTHDSNVGIAFDTISTSTATLDAWFANHIAETAAQGKMSQRQGTTREGALLKDAFTLDIDGEPIRTYVFAYQTAKGKQLMMVGTDRAVPQSDLAVQNAFAEVRRAYESQAYFAGGKLAALKPGLR